MTDAGALEIVRASAPARICDNGGWTDTWFAGHGSVFHIAVEPRVHVELTTFVRSPERAHVVIEAKAFGDRYAPTGIATKAWGRHPLLEATIAEVGVPDDLAIEIVIDSDMPHGASTGTSAAACVALVAALDALGPNQRSPLDIARAAWRVETEQLGLQSGVQDQLAAAFGGINLVDIHSHPDATVDQLAVPAEVLTALQQQLVLVYLGRPHRSSQVHEAVIAALEGEGPNAPRLEALRRTAGPSRDAVLAGDLAALGRTMVDNTEAQRALHHDLVSPAAEQIIEIGRRHDVLGHKVNGAGGDGGSVTLLTNSEPAAARLLSEAIERIDGPQRVIGVRLSPDGVRAVRSPA